MPTAPIVIRRRTGLAALQLSDIWHFRELLALFAWRDVLVRYKQTVIGILWALIRPLLTILVFTFVFGKLGGLPSEGVPYPLLTFAAVLPWQLFATALGDSSVSVVGNAHILSKVYFPRVLIPISAVIASLVDFAISLVIFLIALAVYGVPFSPRLLALPLYIALCITFGLGLGFWFSALFVRYRDVRHLVPFIVQLGIYISPVGFSSDIVPERWRTLYALNPLVAVIDGFRWCTLGQPALRLGEITGAVAVSVILLISGIYYFRQTERTFADLV
ncbi:MAG TPA: ABC transporter permease [Thermoanaerobaculia bacterium]|nr:ABC transporter permease [Thermoanaerobaculia bacterium]